MKIITATVTDQNLIVSSSVLSVSETVGDYNLKITYDSEWDEADKIITFKNSNGLAIAIKDDESEDGVQIPWEILRCPGKVTVGVMGYIGTTQKLATTGIYERNTFIVLPAAFGLQEALTPTPDVYQKLMQALEELQGEIGDLDNLDTTDKSNLVAAINEVLAGGGGTTDFNALVNRPKYNGSTMTGSTNIPKVPNKTSELSNNSGFITSSALSSYATTSDLTTGLATKQNTLSASQLNTVNSGLTSADKTKLDEIEAGAEVNDINSISVNGTPVAPDANKNVNLSVMAYTAGNGLNLTGTEFSADTTVLATKTDLESKQDTLTAGSNITIANDTISATDTTYTAGSGLDLNGTEFSVDTDEIQPKLTAGANVAIDQNNEISATDTTYTAGNGLALNGTEFSADTTVLATKTDLSTKQNTLTAGSNISITGDTISATDTTYSNFVGTDGSTAGTSGLVPAPATTDADKFLKSDGTWAEAGGGSSVNVVQTTGTSTTDVMSQNATTSMVFLSNAIGTVAIGKTQTGTAKDNGVVIGYRGTYPATNGVGIGYHVQPNGYAGVAIGESATTVSGNEYAVGVGGYSEARARYSMALGGYSRATTQGEVSFGGANLGTNGYNGTQYRLLTNVYDPQSAHDAATKGYVDPTTDSTAPTTSTVGRVGQIQIDTSTATAYMCVAADSGTSTYTWKQITA